MKAEDRLRNALAKLVYERGLETGWPHLFDNEIGKIATEVGATEQEARQVLREFLERFFLEEQSRGYFTATALMLVYYEELDRPPAYRQNEIRRYILKETARLEKPEQGSFVHFREDGSDPYPASEMFVAVLVLDAFDLILSGDRGIPSSFTTRLTAKGYDALRDDRVLAGMLPVTASEDADAQAPVASDVLKDVITSCEELLERHEWTQVLVELRRADAEFDDGDWVNAVRDYYASLESGLKYALGDEQVDAQDGRALKRLAAVAADRGVIPRNYQALFGYVDTVRSPRSHGGGPQAEKVGEIEVGRAEALLMGNLTRTLLIYLGQRPRALAA